MSALLSHFKVDQPLLNSLMVNPLLKIFELRVLKNPHTIKKSETSFWNPIIIVPPFIVTLLVLAFVFTYSSICTKICYTICHLLCTLLYLDFFSVLFIPKLPRLP